MSSLSLLTMYDICSNIRNIVLAGDFNAVSKARDRIGSNTNRLKKYETEWNIFFKNLNLIQSNYESVCSLNEKMTWTNNIVSSKIDKIFYSQYLTSKILYVKNFKTCISDHKVVMVTVNLNFGNANFKSPHKFKSWKLDDRILIDNNVEEGVKRICQEIPNIKRKFKYHWYDIFNKKILFFLKKKIKNMIK